MKLDVYDQLRRCLLVSLNSNSVTWQKVLKKSPLFMEHEHLLLLSVNPASRSYLDTV